MNKTFGKILAFGGIFLALLVLGRGLYFAPNNEADPDSGLVASILNNQTHYAEAALPEKLLIPKLNINAAVQHLGVTKAGNMAAPDNFTDVSWYKLGTLPGELGSAVISGHEDNALSLDGVFKHLEDLEIGDRVYVVDKEGQQLEFKVTEKKIYPYNLSGPELERIFHDSDKARLNLITCAGVWLKEAKTNDKRLVVFTELVK